LCERRCAAESVENCRPRIYEPAGQATTARSSWAEHLQSRDFWPQKPPDVHASYFSRKHRGLPDSNSLVVSDRGSSPSEPFALFLVSIETGEKHRLTSPRVQLLGDSGPAFSPDDRTLAFTRSVGPDNSDLYLLALSDGIKPLAEPRRLTFGNPAVTSPTWTANGHEIICANAGVQPSLWRIAARAFTSRPDKPRRLEALGQSIFNPAISGRRNRLTYTHRIFHGSIGRIAAPRASGNSPFDGSGVRTLISSTRYDVLPQFSPSGSRVAFVSDRSGHPEIWACNSDGSNPVQLTALGAPWVFDPRWGPDGERIVFDSDAVDPVFKFCHK